MNPAPISYKYRKMTDHEVISLCQRRDEAAFSELVRRFTKTVRIYAYKFWPVDIEKEDAVQEIWARAWSKFHQLRSPVAFTSWLRSISFNAASDRARRKDVKFPSLSLDATIFDRKNDAMVDEGLLAFIRDHAPNPEEHALAQELVVIVSRALDTLPTHFREATVLREVHDMTYEEIAAATGVNTGTVKSRIYRGRARVKEQINDYVQALPLRLRK